jgi:hypothetical protein
VSGTATDGLHRGPHIFICLYQIPACSKRLLTANCASVIDALRTPCFQVSEHLAPRYISITLHHCVRRTPLERLIREQSRRGVGCFTSTASCHAKFYDAGICHQSVGRTSFLNIATPLSKGYWSY